MNPEHSSSYPIISAEEWDHKDPQQKSRNQSHRMRALSSLVFFFLNNLGF